MSPNVCTSNVAYAVPVSKCPASIDETQAFLGKPLMFAVRFFQVFPPSRVNCTFPSSVPTQIKFESLGDSQIEKIVVCISADELSTVIPPDCSCFCFSASLVVRSDEMRSHVWPRSRERKRN